jgi:thiol-disulfide isomerase/thioredoxin
MLQKIFLSMMVVAIALFTFCSPKSRELQPKRTVISGKVINMAENATVLLVNFCNPLSEEQRFAQDLAASNGTFHVAHDYVFAQNLSISYDRSFINLYVAPGDSVFLTIDGLKFQQHSSDAVTFSGDNAKINGQLFRWAKYAYQLPIPQFNTAAPPDEYLHSVGQCFGAMQDTIAAYAQRNEMNDFVKRWAFVDYKFVAANYMLDYEDKANKWSVFTDSIFDLYSEQNFQSMYFQYHLGACMNALVAGNEEIRDLLNSEKYKTALHALAEELSEKAPEGVVRDMMLYSFAHRVMEKMPELYDSIPELKSFFSQPVVREKIKSFAREKSANAKKPLPVTGKMLKGVSYLDAETQRVAPLPDVEVLPYLVERHKNKVLYIDVWASWCGPCLEEMKYAPTLHKYFAEKDATGKEVVFINLCLESSSESWLKTVNKNAIEGENYYLDANASKIFMGAYNIDGFPTYMLIDRSGQLRSPVARPSNAQSAIKQINTLL